MKTALPLMQSILLAGTVAIALPPSWSAEKRSPQPVTCLKGFDPVALTQGREVPGKTDIAVAHGRYRYLFSSQENKSAFESHPDRYEIQLGGGCGRMGPLSGLGSPDRFWVHDRRIYVFASDQCMNSFKAAPDKHIESDDPPPTGSGADLQRGLELVDRALAGFGGAASVDSITSLELKRVRAYKADGEDKEQATFNRMIFPDRFRLDEVWHNGAVHDFVRFDTGFRVASDGAWPMDELVRREFIKSFRRNPLVLLKARKEPGFRAVAAGIGKIGEHGVEWLALGLDGANCTLGIEVATGRVLGIRYRGRAPSAIGDVVRTFSDFRNVDGVNVPFAVATSFNDAAASEPRLYAAVRVNPKFDPGLFASPE